MVYYIYCFRDCIAKIIVGVITFMIIYALGKAVFEHSEHINTIVAGVGGMFAPFVLALLDNNDKV